MMTRLAGELARCITGALLIVIGVRIMTDAPRPPDHPTLAGGMRSGMAGTLPADSGDLGDE